MGSLSSMYRIVLDNIIKREIREYQLLRKNVFLNFVSRPTHMHCAEFTPENKHNIVFLMIGQIGQPRVLKNSKTPRFWGLNILYFS